MLIHRLWRCLFTGAVSILLFAGCSGSGSADPAAQTIQDYLQALVAKDVNTMIDRSCAGWESQARLEYDSFAAVEVALEGPVCAMESQEQAAAVVSCTGKIIASYGAEDLVIDLQERRYQVVQESGEWRMCGYR